MKPTKKPKKGVPRHLLPKLPKGKSALAKKFKARQKKTKVVKKIASVEKTPKEEPVKEKKPGMLSRFFLKQPGEAAKKEEKKEKVSEPEKKLPKEEPKPQKVETPAEETPKEVPEEKPSKEVQKEPAKEKPVQTVPETQKKTLSEKIKGLFKKKPKDTEERAEHIVTGMRRGEKPKRKRLQRKSLQQYLDKAGFELDAERVKKYTYQAVITLFLLGSGLMLYRFGCWGVNACSAAGVWRTLLFFGAVWSVLFCAGIITAMGIIYFYLDYRIYKRTQEVEDVLADFLQLASANIAAGMPIDRALWYSIRPSFGVLAKEMEEVAKATMSGEGLEESLILFSKKYDSKLLKRSISIIIEGLHSGGELADLLNKIALNIDEIKIMKKEMAANVTTYAIFIIVAAVGIAPVLFALATQLLSIIASITATLDMGSTSGFLTIEAVNPQTIINFKTYSYLMLIVSSVFGASIVSIIQRGSVIEGIKTIPIYGIVAILLYTFSVSFFGGIFGGLV